MASADEVRPAADAAAVAALRKQVADLTKFTEQLGSEICAILDHLDAEIEYGPGGMKVVKS